MQIRRIRHALVTSLLADAASFLFAFLACSILFGR